MHRKANPERAAKERADAERAAKAKADAEAEAARERARREVARDLGFPPLGAMPTLNDELRDAACNGNAAGVRDLLGRGANKNGQSVRMHRDRVGVARRSRSHHVVPPVGRSRLVASLASRAGRRRTPVRASAVGCASSRVDVRSFALSVAGRTPATIERTRASSVGPLPRARYRNERRSTIRATSHITLEPAR